MGNDGLYNGNIATMTTDLPAIGYEQGDRQLGMQAMVYQYDQLNRINRARSLTNYQEATGFQRENPGAYDTDYTYDPNGNLLTLRRNNEEGELLDDFEYTYFEGTNRLRQYKPIDQDRIYTGVVRSNEELFRRITAQENSYVEPNGEDERIWVASQQRS